MLNSNAHGKGLKPLCNLNMLNLFKLEKQIVTYHK